MVLAANGVWIWTILAIIVTIERRGGTRG